MTNKHGGDLYYVTLVSVTSGAEKGQPPQIMTTAHKTGPMSPWALFSQNQYYSITLLLDSKTQLYS